MEFHKYANIFPLIDEFELNILKEDIEKNGLNNPIVLYEGKILDGRNRYKACQLISDFKIEYEEFNGDDALSFVLSENLHRRHLTQSQKAAIIADMDEIILKLKQESKQISLSNLENSNIECEKFHSRGRINEKLGNSLDVNYRYVSDAQKIKKTNQNLHEKVKQGKLNIPEAKLLLNKTEEEQNKLIEDVKSGEAKNIKDAIKQDKIEERKQEIEQQNKEIEKLPDIDKKFDLIVIDPPWAYEPFGNPVKYRGEPSYPNMSIKEISNIKLPVKDDSILFFWTTNKFLHESFHILKEWNFEYKVTLTWDKKKMGVGKWLRIQCEFCLLAIKGKPLWEVTDMRDIISESRREHSRKPDIFYNLIDEKFPLLSKIDYFSRTERKGWVCFGSTRF